MCVIYVGYVCIHCLCTAAISFRHLESDLWPPPGPASVSLTRAVSRLLARWLYKRPRDWILEKIHQIQPFVTSINYHSDKRELRSRFLSINAIIDMTERTNYRFIDPGGGWVACLNIVYDTWLKFIAIITLTDSAYILCISCAPCLILLLQMCDWWNATTDK